VRNALVGGENAEASSVRTEQLADYGVRGLVKRSGTVSARLHRVPLFSIFETVI
jgi:hypothetical protein